MLWIWINKKRWDFVFNKANKVSCCGEENDDGCGCIQPDKIKKDGLASIFAEWKPIKDKSGQKIHLMKL